MIIRLFHSRADTYKKYSVSNMNFMQVCFPLRIDGRFRCTSNGLWQLSRCHLKFVIKSGLLVEPFIFQAVIVDGLLDDLNQFSTANFYFPPKFLTLAKWFPIPQITILAKDRPWTIGAENSQQVQLWQQNHSIQRHLAATFKSTQDDAQTNTCHYQLWINGWCIINNW